MLNKGGHSAEGLNAYREHISRAPHPRLSAETKAALQVEAALLEARAAPATIAQFHIHEDESLRGKRRVSVAAAGAALDALHQNVGLDLARQLLADVGARQVYPTRACYLYYGIGDFALLHHDVTQCTATLLVAVAGTPQPLILYPSFGQAVDSDIEALNAAPVAPREVFESFLADHIAATRLESTVVDFPPGAIAAQRGRDVPHARYPQDSPVTMAALCYASLVHHPAWLAA